MKKNNKKGFTLAELLIVVAIIGVLTAIAIPVFTSQLARSKEAADVANVRSAYAEAVANYLSDEISTYPTADSGPALNNSGYLTWTGGSTLTVTYSGSHQSLSLSGGAK